MRTGGCQCGAVRYETVDEPVELYVCHCLECRKQSASAFGISFIVARRDIKVTQGEPRFWTRAADSGARVACAFCPECGSRVWHEDPDDPARASIKGGTLDEAPDIAGVDHIWTKRKMPGVAIPAGVRQFPGEPDVG